MRTTKDYSHRPMTLGFSALYLARTSRGFGLEDLVGAGIVGAAFRLSLAGIEESFVDTFFKEKGQPEVVGDTTAS
jgi:hypothetical protein